MVVSDIDFRHTESMSTGRNEGFMKDLVGWEPDPTKEDPGWIYKQAGPNFSKTARRRGIWNSRGDGEEGSWLSWRKGERHIDGKHQSKVDQTEHLTRFAQA